MKSDDHLSEFVPEGEDVTIKGMVLTQCFCDSCSNSFYVEGRHEEFLPQYCCYCGGEFYKTSEIDDDFTGEEFLWM